MADLRDAVNAPPSSIDDHAHVIVFARAEPRAPRKGEPGTDWLKGASAPAAGLRATEIANKSAFEFRLLMFVRRE